MKYLELNDKESTSSFYFLCKVKVPEPNMPRIFCTPHPPPPSSGSQEADLYGLHQLVPLSLASGRIWPMGKPSQKSDGGQWGPFLPPVLRSMICCRQGVPVELRPQIWSVVPSSWLPLLPLPPSTPPALGGQQMAANPFVIRNPCGFPTPWLWL